MSQIPQSEAILVLTYHLTTSQKPGHSTYKHLQLGRVFFYSVNKTKQKKHEDLQHSIEYDIMIV